MFLPNHRLKLTGAAILVSPTFLRAARQLSLGVCLLMRKSLNLSA